MRIRIRTDALTKLKYALAERRYIRRSSGTMRYYKTRAAREDRHNAKAAIRAELTYC